MAMGFGLVGEVLLYILCYRRYNGRSFVAVRDCYAWLIRLFLHRYKAPLHRFVASNDILSTGFK